MKKVIVIIIGIAMILTITVPAFADESDVTMTKPVAVQELKVLKNGYKSLKVTWKAVDGADKYNVYRSKTGKAGSFSLKKTTTGNTYTNTGLICGKTYWYKVRAVNSKGKGVFSVVKSSRVQPATAKITSVPLGGNSGPYDYAPKPTWNKVAGATGYQLYRTIEGKNKWSRIATTTRTYYLDNPKAGFEFYRNYEYKVRAYRTVNGKKVYGYFSKLNKYVPDWNIKDVVKDLADYGETIKGQKMIYNLTTEEYEPYNGPMGSTYTMRHCIGWDTATGLGVYTNPAYGMTNIPDTSTYEAYTPENSSWTALFPEILGHYWKKETVMKRGRSMVKFAIESEMKANPVAFNPSEGNEMDPEWWGGTEEFTLYARKATGSYENGYNFWVMH